MRCASILQYKRNSCELDDENTSDAMLLPTSPTPVYTARFCCFFKREVKRGVSFNGPERSWACDSSLHTAEEPRSYFKEVGALLCGLSWWI
jgi:hypothetical protein